MEAEGKVPRVASVVRVGGEHGDLVAMCHRGDQHVDRPADDAMGEEYHPPLAQAADLPLEPAISMDHEAGGVHATDTAATPGTRQGRGQR